MRRSLLIFSLFSLLGLVAPASAQSTPVAAPFDDETRTQLVDQAKALRDQADVLKRDTEERFTRDDAACYRKFLSNDCRDEVKEKRSQAIVEVRKLESEARAIDRRVRQRDAVVHEAERREAMPRRAQEQAEQALRFREAQEQSANERAKRLSDKQRPAGPAAAPGAARSAPDGSRANAARQSDLDDTAKRMAERDQRVADKAAERAKKAAEKAAERAAE